MGLKNSLCKIVWDLQIVPLQYSHYLYRHLKERPSVPFTKKFYGYNYKGNLNNYTDRHVFYYGACEKSFLIFFETLFKSLTHRPNVLDIGCNIGHHTLFFSRFANHVYSIDPLETVLKTAQDRISANNIHNVRFFKVGLSNEEKILTYKIPSSNHPGRGSFEPDMNNEAKETTQLQVVHASKFLKEKNISNLDFIKIDVEGHERFALDGLSETFIYDKPFVFFELTLGKTNSIKSFSELTSFFPKDYTLLFFKKSRLRASITNKVFGKYFLTTLSDISFEKLKNKQLNIFAYPIEKKAVVNSIGIYE